MDRGGVVKGSDCAVGITHFARRRPGPEATIEDAVALQIPYLFQSRRLPLWTARSASIGAGRPDLVAVSYEPRVLALAELQELKPDILAYLRGIRCARLETIADRLDSPRQQMARRLERLAELDVVGRQDETFWLLPRWRYILPDVVSIEVKVSDWGKAVQQAARNRIFAHRSFVAVPEWVAQRVRREPVFRELGIGLLAVSNGDEVTVVRRARREKPIVWTYYYRLASLAAIHSQE